MRNRMLAALAGLALVLGLGVATSPVQAAGSGLTPPVVSAATSGKPPVGVKAPKGKYNPNQERINARLLTGPYYFYGTAGHTMSAAQSATFLSANLHIENTYLDTSMDSHTLDELAVQSLNQQQVVEVGSTVDPVICGAGNSPCLFVFWWKNGVPQCYNGCGFVPYAPTCSVAANFCAGESIAAHVGTTKKFIIQYSGGVWWIAYDNQWIGHLPGSLWTASVPSGPGVTFDKGQVFQVFYEVATKTTGDTTPCTDMGNGLDGATNGSAARMGSMSYATLTTPAGVTENFTASATAPYTSVALSNRTSRAGGPGYDSLGLSPGNVGSC